MSRASSVSANNRSTASKKAKPIKQRRDDTDGFDSRRQYAPYWGPQQQTWVSQPPSQFIPPANGQFNSQPVPSYPAQAATDYSQQPPGYPAAQGMALSVPYPTPPQVCNISLLSRKTNLQLLICSSRMRRSLCSNGILQTGVR